MADDRAQQPDLDAEWEALARYLARESAPDEEERIRKQLASNPDRSALVESLDASLVAPAEAPLSTSEVEAALAVVLARRDAVNGALSILPGGAAPIAERPSVQVARLRSRWRRSGLRAAAAVLIVAGGSMLWRATRPATPQTQAGATTALASAPALATGVGRVDSVKLADGTRAILGPMSTLNVAGGYGVSSREVMLTGEAFFDVVHDARVPFVVRTSSATMRDVGTSFSVRGDGQRATRVAVSTGAVDVAALGASSTPVVLRAGDRAVVGSDGVHVERGVVSSDELSWTRGVLVFDDAPIAEVATGLRRWFGLALVVTDSVLANRRLTASFDRAIAADVGAVLAAALGASVTRSGDTLRLSPAALTR
ncbi:MAG: FecR domain-containing protein [bacterium]